MNKIVGLLDYLEIVLERDFSYVKLSILHKIEYLNLVQSYTYLLQELQGYTTHAFSYIGK